jgi:hypothetical protein
MEYKDSLQQANIAVALVRRIKTESRVWLDVAANQNGNTQPDFKYKLMKHLVNTILNIFCFHL